MDFTKPQYIDWIIKENGIVFEDGVPLECYKVSFDLANDSVLDDYATHVRRHYKTDEDLADSMESLKISEREYLKDNVIPQKSQAWGSQTIAAEFCEIMLYDLFEHILDYTALRGRHWDKPTPASPIQGSDVMAFKISKSGKSSPSDELCIIEVKAKLSPERPSTKDENYKALASAKMDSDTDSLRYSVSLDFMRSKYKAKGEYFLKSVVARFQQKATYPYVQKFVAAAVISREKIEKNIIVGINGEDLKITASDQVFLIHGEKLMDLANAVYERIIK